MRRLWGRIRGVCLKHRLNSFDVELPDLLRIDPGSLTACELKWLVEPPDCALPYGRRDHIANLRLLLSS